MGSHDSGLLTLKEKITYQMLSHREQIFKLKIKQERLWFTLRLCIGYTSLIILPVALFSCVFIIMNHSIFPETIITSAGYALSGGVLGLSASTWKIIVNPIKEELSKNKK